jgi:uncharacterized YigZ family protein
MSTLPQTYNTISQSGRAEFTDRGSKFIGCALPMHNAAELKNLLNSIKDEYKKANHYCFAWRLGTDGNNSRASDDGEPSGTAGRPILAQIDSRGLTNLLVVVVRYFGGTLLGTQGLIHAYKTTASLVLQVTPVLTQDITATYTLHFDYTRLNEVMRITRQVRGEVVHTGHGLFSSLTIRVPLSEAAVFEKTMERYHDVEVISSPARTG